MPKRAGRRCPRCRQVYSGTSCDRCAKRDQAYVDDRADDERLHYQTAEWARVSRHYLNNHPWCCLCAADGKQVKATVADHYPTSRRDLIAKGINYPDAWRFLRPLCVGHHRSETNRLQPGGFIKHRERY